MMKLIQLFFKDKIIAREIDRSMTYIDSNIEWPFHIYKIDTFKNFAKFDSLFKTNKWIEK